MSITISSPKYVNVILPLAVPKNYTYKVPSSMCGDIEFGKRVEVPLRNRAYSAIIVETMNEVNVNYKAKDIRAVIDKEPIITERQYDLWKWMAKYYCCTVGEVMMVALPSGLKLTSETKLIISPDFDEDYSDFDEMEYLIAEAISIQNELTIDQVKDITDRKVVYPYIRKLLDRRVLYIKEELRSKYKPKQITVVALSDSYQDTEASINVAFERIGKSELQHKALLSFYKLYRQQNEVSKAALMELSGVSSAVIKGLEKKGILDIYKKEISRLTITDVINEAVMPPLSTQQIDAIATIKEAWEEKETCLIHGITGSGKTRVYMELMQEYLGKGKQVLYLLPEIALTSQIVNRLEAVFGDRIVLYHSRLNQHERVEIWNAVLHEAKILVGARSSLLLPYRNIGLIIVDEEHDGSYKQHDPSPRYNARDTASVIASQFGAKVLLGSATPSLESYFNAKLGKYGLTELRQRHSKVA
ncbi:MAG TPA: primosomal protein N', partial [Saprospirales bacterium]|nr:primosomal protein N' [Saprospirales bacterium]